MLTKIKTLPVALASCMLILLAEISTSTNTIFFWHEIDCPEELIKK